MRPYNNYGVALDLDRIDAISRSGKNKVHVATAAGHEIRLYWDNPDDVTKFYEDVVSVWQTQIPEVTIR